MPLFPFRFSLAFSLVILATLTDQGLAGNDGWPFGGARPWNYADPDSGGHWFSEFQQVLETMQTDFWNGTYWPATIQWIGAVLDTFLAASDTSFANALIEYNGTIAGAQSTAVEIAAEIDHYFGQIEAYFSDEDTIQIFGAAYDDAQWVVLEWLEAIKFVTRYDSHESIDLGRNLLADFAHRAHIFYNIVQNKFDTSLCDGGLTWNPALAVYKNAITNELFLSSSIGMYLYFPGDENTDPYPSPSYTSITKSTLPPLPALKQHDQLLLSNAIEEYNWFKTLPFRNAQGLVIDGFHVSDNQTTCDEPSEMVYTYNQGVLLSGLRQLWEATGDVKYLNDAYSYVSSTINATGWYARTSTEAGQWSGLGRNGIMEDYCDATADCSQDARIFKGVYFHHFDVFCEPLPTTKPLIPGLTYTASEDLAASHAEHCSSYLPWVQHNAVAALATRNGSDVIGEWWGAAYLNKTQEPSSQYSVSRPGPDPWSNPAILTQSPWICRGWHCGNEPQHHNPATYGRLARRSGAHMRQRQSVDSNDTRTVETQGSGLAVVKAASDMNFRRTAS